MIDFHELLEATRKRIIGIVLIGLGSISVMYPLREMFMDFIKQFNALGMILIGLVLISLGTYLTLKKD